MIIQYILSFFIIIFSPFHPQKINNILSLILNSHTQRSLSLIINPINITPILHQQLNKLNLIISRCQMHSTIWIPLTTYPSISPIPQPKYHITYNNLNNYIGLSSFLRYYKEWHTVRSASSATFISIPFYKKYLIV